MSWDISRSDFDEAVAEEDWEWLWSAYEALRIELGRTDVEFATGKYAVEIYRRLTDDSIEPTEEMKKLFAEDGEESKGYKMSDEIKELLGQLEETCTEMKGMSVKGDSQIQKADRLLAKMGVNIPFWLCEYQQPYMSRQIGSRCTQWSFGYSKVNGEWHLACRREYCDVMLLTEAPVDVRIMGAHFLPAMLEELDRLAQHHIKSVDWALEFASHVATALEKKLKI